jgi:hypothetical protein
LTTHPPQQAPAQPRQLFPETARPTSRPTLLDKLALHLGLWLITYGRRRYSATAAEAARHRENDRARAHREAGWQAQRLPMTAR